MRYPLFSLRSHDSRRAFTLVELIVVVTILAILSSVGYVSYSNSVVDTRDTQRMSDMDSLLISLKSHKQKEGSYPLPITPFDLVNTGFVAARQGVLSDAILSNVLKNIPKDPKSKAWYSYSVNANRQQFQLALTQENQWSPLALVSGDYKSVAKNLFPTMLVAYTGGTSIDMSESATSNRSRFIVNKGSYNLPYDMSGKMIAKGTSFTGVVNEAGVTMETGGFYLSCDEVYQAGMSMGAGAYQIVSSTGVLVDTTCTMIY